MSESNRLIAGYESAKIPYLPSEIWCLLRESNSRLADYKSAAVAAEPRRHLVATTGNAPVSDDYQSSVLLLN